MVQHVACNSVSTTTTCMQHCFMSNYINFDIMLIKMADMSSAAMCIVIAMVKRKKRRVKKEKKQNYLDKRMDQK